MHQRVKYLQVDESVHMQLCTHLYYIQQFNSEDRHQQGVNKTFFKFMIMHYDQKIKSVNNMYT